LPSERARTRDRRRAWWCSPGRCEPVRTTATRHQVRIVVDMRLAHGSFLCGCAAPGLGGYDIGEARGGAGSLACAPDPAALAALEAALPVCSVGACAPPCCVLPCCAPPCCA